MAERQRVGRTGWVHGGIALLLLVSAGCGNGTSAPIPKPGDAKAALLDAVARTANFKDVEWDDTQLIISGGQHMEFGNSYAATKNPPRIRNRTKPATGAHSLTTIQDLADNLFCTMPEGGPNQRFPGQGASVDTADPFYDLKVNGSAWSFLPNASVNGHADWNLMGNLSLGPGSGQFTATSSTVEVLIDPRSGKIEKLVAHAVLTRAGQPGVTDRTSTDSNFVYDTGATISAC